VATKFKTIEVWGGDVSELVGDCNEFMSQTGRIFQGMVWIPKDGSSGMGNLVIAYENRPPMMGGRSVTG
jgi:hypothetical protein